MSSSLAALSLLLFLLAPHTQAIGENALDLNSITGILGGIGSMLATDTNTINVPSSLLLGTWHQMYKAAINFDVFRTTMFCHIAYFKPNPIMGEGGFSIEEAYRTSSKTGPLETYKRDMNRIAPGQYWMYTEEYFYPRQFYIISAGPSFDNETGLAEDGKLEYLIVSDANRLSLMVFARDPQTFFQRYNKEVQAFLENRGYGGSVFWNSPKPVYQGPDCEWPSEKEVFARRVLKNREIAQRAKTSSNTGGMSDSPIADMIRNPKQTLERLVSGQK